MGFCTATFLSGAAAIFLKGSRAKATEAIAAFCIKERRLDMRFIKGTIKELKLNLYLHKKNREPKQVRDFNENGIVIYLRISISSIKL
jgi:hypothetical protein